MFWLPRYICGYYSIPSCHDPCGLLDLPSNRSLEIIIRLTATRISFSVDKLIYFMIYLAVVNQ